MNWNDSLLQIAEGHLFYFIANISAIFTFFPIILIQLIQLKTGQSVNIFTLQFRLTSDSISSNSWVKMS